LEQHLKIPRPAMPGCSSKVTDLIWVIFASIVVFTICREASATEGGGSLHPPGIATVLPGVSPTPPGFNILNYNQLYNADRLNNSRGGKAVPHFHVDVMVSSLRLDYSLPEPIGGIRFGVQFIVPFSRVNLRIGNGPGAFHQEKAGLGDISVAPLVAGWEFDTPIGHVNQHGRVGISFPTGSFKSTDRVNLGRNYTGLILNQGNSLFPTKYTHIGFQVNYGTGSKNPATNYQSGDEVILEWSMGYDITRDFTVDLNGYYYQQITNDYRAGVLVNGDGNKGRAVGIGPQIRFKLHPGAITAKWQTEMAVQNRAQGNRFWLQSFYPLGSPAP
jgi:hypothetical protein